MLNLFSNVGTAVLCVVQLCVHLCLDAHTQTVSHMVFWARVDVLKHI